MPRAFNDHQAPKRSLPRGFSRKACATKKKKKKKVPSRSPGPSQNAPGPERLAHGLPQCLEAKLCWVPSRVLGKARDSRAGHSAKRPRAPVMQRGCIARFPACPAAPPKLGHSPTPAAPDQARRWRLHARALRLRFGRLGERASERANERGARARSDGPFPAVDGKRGSEDGEGCRAHAGGGGGLCRSRPR